MQFQIIDHNGDTVVSADTITWFAKAQRVLPKTLARRDARHMTNAIDGTFKAQAVN